MKSAYSCWVMFPFSHYLIFLSFFSFNFFCHYSSSEIQAHTSTLFLVTRYQFGSHTWVDDVLALSFFFDFLIFLSHSHFESRSSGCFTCSCPSRTRGLLTKRDAYSLKISKKKYFTEKLNIFMEPKIC